MTEEIIIRNAAEALDMAEKNNSPVYVVIENQIKSDCRITCRDEPPKDAPCVVVAPGDTVALIAERMTRMLGI